MGKRRLVYRSHLTYVDSLVSQQVECDCAGKYERIFLNHPGLN